MKKSEILRLLNPKVSDITGHSLGANEYYRDPLSLFKERNLNNFKTHSFDYQMPVYGFTTGEAKKVAVKDLKTTKFFSPVSSYFTLTDAYTVEDVHIVKVRIPIKDNGMFFGEKEITSESLKTFKFRFTDCIVSRLELSARFIPSANKLVKVRFLDNGMNHGEIIGVLNAPIEMARILSITSNLGFSGLLSAYYDSAIGPLGSSYPIGCFESGGKFYSLEPKPLITCPGTLKFYPQYVKALQMTACNNEKAVDFIDYMIGQSLTHVAPMFGDSIALNFAFALSAQVPFESGYNEKAVVDPRDYNTGATGLFQMVVNGGLGATMLSYGFERGDLKDGKKQIDFMMKLATTKGSLLNRALSNAPQDSHQLEYINRYVTEKLIVPWVDSTELLEKEVARRADWLVKTYHIPGYENYIPLEELIIEKGGQKKCQ